jgi:hypothetical protein
MFKVIVAVFNNTLYKSNEFGCSLLENRQKDLVKKILNFQKYIKFSLQKYMKLNVLSKNMIMVKTFHYVQFLK